MYGQAHVEGVLVLGVMKGSISRMFRASSQGLVYHAAANLCPTLRAQRSAGCSGRCLGGSVDKKNKGKTTKIFFFERTNNKAKNTCFTSFFKCLAWTFACSDVIRSTGHLQVQNLIYPIYNQPHRVVLCTTLMPV